MYPGRGDAQLIELSRQAAKLHPQTGVWEASTGQYESHFGSSEPAAAILQRAVESRLQQTGPTELASRVEPTRSVSRIVASSTDSATELPGDPRPGRLPVAVNTAFRTQIVRAGLQAPSRERESLGTAPAFRAERKWRACRNASAHRSA